MIVFKHTTQSICHTALVIAQSRTQNGDLLSCFTYCPACAGCVCWLHVQAVCAGCCRPVPGAWVSTAAPLLVYQAPVYQAVHSAAVLRWCVHAACAAMHRPSSAQPRSSVMFAHCLHLSQLYNDSYITHYYQQRCRISTHWRGVCYIPARLVLPAGAARSCCFKVMPTASLASRQSCLSYHLVW
jgi:hypothetical protein